MQSHSPLVLCSIYSSVQLLCKLSSLLLLVLLLRVTRSSLFYSSWFGLLQLLVPSFRTSLYHQIESFILSFYPQTQATLLISNQNVFNWKERFLLSHISCFQPPAPTLLNQLSSLSFTTFFTFSFVSWFDFTKNEKFFSSISGLSKMASLIQIQEFSN